MKFTDEQLARLKKLKYFLDGADNRVYSDDGYADSLITIDDFGNIRYDYVPHDYPEDAQFHEFADFDELADMLDI